MPVEELGVGLTVILELLGVADGTTNEADGVPLGDGDGEDEDEA